MITNHFLRRLPHTRLLYRRVSCLFAAQKPKKIDLQQQLTSKPIESKQQAKSVFMSGRSWKANQLRIKSNQDLHKLWYVCIKEKNTMLSQKSLYKRTAPEQNRSVMRRLESNLTKLDQTMTRITAVMAERQKVRDEYRRSLEEDYIERKRQEMQHHLNKTGEDGVPEVTWRLMKEKMRELRKGIDNTDYIERQRKFDEEQNKKRMELTEKFKTPVPEFTSFFQQELESGRTLKPSQEEILRSHVKNWRQLSMKQRRTVLGFLNARRARDAKAEFVKELRQLGKKIAYEQSNKQFETKQPQQQPQQS